VSDNTYQIHPVSAASISYNGNIHLGRNQWVLIHETTEELINPKCSKSMAFSGFIHRGAFKATVEHFVYQSHGKGDHDDQEEEI
jgi:hypothetical protein